MQPDQARIEDVREWLRHVQVDLRAGAHDLEASPSLFDDVVFHAQQAPEKSIKGFLVWHDRPFRRTHDLAELGREAMAIDASPEQGLAARRPPSPEGSISLLTGNPRIRGEKLETNG